MNIKSDSLDVTEMVVRRVTPSDYHSHGIFPNPCLRSYLLLFVQSAAENTITQLRHIALYRHTAMPPLAFKSICVRKPSTYKEKKKQENPELTLRWLIPENVQVVFCNVQALGPHCNQHFSFYFNIA